MTPTFRLSRIAGVLAGLIFWTASLHAASPRLNCESSWLGNSFPGAQHWVPQDLRAMCITADGTVFTTGEWDEGGREVGVYKDGAVIGNAGHTHGWGNNGGRAIAVNSKYVFIAQNVGNEGGGLKDTNTWPAKGLTWFGISRRLRADITKGAPFEGGKGAKGDTLRGCFLVVVEAPEKTKLGIEGLCADERRIYVSCTEGNEIRVFDTETMKPVARWACSSPGPLALDKAGTLWVLPRGTGVTPVSISHLSANGDVLPQKIPFPADAKATSLCLDSKGRLLVADAGPSQQILIFDNLDTAPCLTDTFGVKGGIFAGRAGVFGDLRFNHPSAIGCDAKGNLFVAHDGQTGGGGTVLESYTLTGQLNWRLFGLEFVDMADVDPLSDTDVFTKEERFTMDYTKPAGQQWAYRAYTVHPFKYPQDPRLHIWSAGAWVRRIFGSPVLFVNDMNGEYLQVYRFDPKHDGEIAVPSSLFAKRRVKKDEWPPHQPEKGEWIWRDENGNGAFDAKEFDTPRPLGAGEGGATAPGEGKDAPSLQGWWVDRAGSVWQATETKGLRKFALQGLDSSGNPMWNYAHVQTFTPPAEFKQIKRLRYDSDADVMYLGGTTDEHKNQHWKPMGPILCRYDHWSQPDRKLRWRIVAPYATGAQGHESCEPMGFDVAGDYLFVPYTGASKQLGFTSGHIEVLKAGDGSAVGHFEPSAEIGEIGLQDIRETLTAHQRANGEYLVFLEEDWKAKILLFRWKP